MLCAYLKYLSIRFRFQVQLPITQLEPTLVCGIKQDLEPSVKGVKGIGLELPPLGFFFGLKKELELGLILWWFGERKLEMFFWKNMILIIILGIGFFNYKFSLGFIVRSFQFWIERSKFKVIFSFLLLHFFSWCCLFFVFFTLVLFFTLTLHVNVQGVLFHFGASHWCLWFSIFTVWLWVLFFKLVCCKPPLLNMLSPLFFLSHYKYSCCNL